MTRPRARYVYGAVAYWTLNAALLLGEARWHVLSRLTVWDIVTLRTVAPELAKLVHAALGAPHP